jgi:hypothetical protein
VGGQSARVHLAVLYANAAVGHLAVLERGHAPAGAKEVRMVRRLAALLAAMSLSLLLVSPALATVPLHQGGDIDWNDTEFQGSADECAGVVLEPGDVLWHFILEGALNNDETLTASWEDGTVVNGMLPTKFSPMNDSADHYVLHWDVVTTQTTLITASATGDEGTLNLSHICPGSPPPEIPEAPASVLLVGAGSIGLLAFFLMRQRRASRI